MIDVESRLQLDSPVPIVGPRRVRVILLYPDPEQEEIDETEWLRAAATNPAFSFLQAEEEDLYSLADGVPFDGANVGQG